jgi:SAM-dependent methyltransferase
MAPRGTQAAILVKGRGSVSGKPRRAAGARSSGVAGAEYTAAVASSQRWTHRFEVGARQLREWARPAHRSSASTAATTEPQAGPENILANPYLTAKLLSPARGDIVVLKQEPVSSDPHLPVPPNTYWEGYGPDEATYLKSGREHMASMLAVLQTAGAEPEGFARVLDFGCAAGRMLRWFPSAATSERWGCDIKGDTIAWCQQHLSPPMQFVTTTTFPHLPFEDGYFDLVYCGSVFTHIIDLPDAWFLELRRTIRTGGYGYVTIFDKHSLDLVLNPPADAPTAPSWFSKQLREFDARTGAFNADFAYFSVDEGPRWNGMPVPQVCYDIDYLTRKWSALVEIVSINTDAYAYQTGVLFRKK